MNDGEQFLLKKRLLSFVHKERKNLTISWEGKMKDLTQPEAWLARLLRSVGIDSEQISGDVRPCVNSEETHPEVQAYIPPEGSFDAMLDCVE